MGSSKKQKKRNQRKRAKLKRKSERARHLQAHLPAPFNAGNTTIIATPAGEPRMSEVMLEFIKPLTGPNPGVEQLRKCAVVGMVAWNMTLLSEERRAELFDATAQTVPPELRAGYRMAVAALMERKKAFFAGNRKTIIDCKVSMTPDGPHLSVLSTLSPEASQRAATVAHAQGTTSKPGGGASARELDTSDVNPLVGARASNYHE